MRHNVFGRKLGRTSGERKLLFRSLAQELVLHGRVQTTLAKAKAVKPFVEKLVTKGKRANLASRRAVERMLSPQSTQILMDSVAPRFATRNGGYSRIVRIGQRTGDNTEMVILEWVEQILPAETKGKKSKKDKKEQLQAEVKTSGKKAKAETKKAEKKTKEKPTTKETKKTTTKKITKKKGAK